MFKRLVGLLLVLCTVGAVSAAITHGTNQRGALAQNVLDSCGTTALLIVLTSGDSPLDTTALQNPAFTRSGAVLTCAGVPLESTASATGTAAKFKVVNAAGSTVFTGSVTATGGGGDMEIDNTSIASGQTVRLTSLTYTSAP